MFFLIFLAAECLFLFLLPAPILQKFEKRIAKSAKVCTRWFTLFLATTFFSFLTSDNNFNFRFVTYRRFLSLGLFAGANSQFFLTNFGSDYRRF